MTRPHYAITVPATRSLSRPDTGCHSNDADCRGVQSHLQAHSSRLGGGLCNFCRLPSCSSRIGVRDFYNGLKRGLVFQQRDRASCRGVGRLSQGLADVRCRTGREYVGTQVTTKRLRCVHMRVKRLLSGHVHQVTRSFLAKRLLQRVKTFMALASFCFYQHRNRTCPPVLACVGFL